MNANNQCSLQEYHQTDYIKNIFDEEGPYGEVDCAGL